MSATSTGPWRRRFIVSLAAVGVLATVALAIADPFDPATESLFDLFGDLAFVMSLLAFIVSGLVILVRRPDNRIGWLLLLPGVVMPVAEVTTRWLTWMGPPTEVTPALWLILWATGWAWVVLAFGTFHLLLTFPTGRLLTPRWRGAVALEAALVGFVVVLGAVTDPIGPMVDGEMTWTVQNPVGLVAGDVMDSAIGLAWGAGLVTITVLSAVALVLRFRRGTSDEREQLKWPVAAALLFGAIYAMSIVAAGLPGGPYPVDALLGYGLAAIPVSVAIAVLRYRLYEIDRIVSRTIAWTLTTGLILVLFGIIVLAFSTTLGTGNTVSVAVATLVAAALFQPIRGRLQRVVDRRFNRAHVDAARTVDAFAERLRDQVTIDVVTAELHTTVVATLQPASQALWLRSATNLARPGGS